MSPGCLTSTAVGTLYFGYGSNLSPFQMSVRCPSSGTPIAIAKLNSWCWIISERGYANLVPMRPAETSLDTDATTVWGVLYHLSTEDEAALDGYEGWSSETRGEANPDSEQRLWKPFEQGRATYNKMYLAVKVEKWLISDAQKTLGISEKDIKTSIVRTLVYVDEERRVPGRIKQSYVRRMGRAARECIPLGVPERWINNVLSQHGIDQNDPKSFIDDIVPKPDANPPPKTVWETTRQRLLESEMG